MKISDTISVNPGKTTLGHSENKTSGIFRVEIANIETGKNKLDLLSFLYPTTSSGLSGLRTYSLPLRALFATVMIVSGIVLLQQSGLHDNSVIGIMEIIFGGILGIGFLTRPLMLGASFFFAIFTALSIRNGNPDVNCLSLMFGCMVFAILGAGKYSVDLILRGLIKRTHKHSVSKKAQRAAGYRAFHYAK